MRVDVIVISLESHVPSPISRLFPDAILHPATDLREWDPVKLQEQGLVTRTGAQDIIEGRRRHRDLSAGAVGLHWSVHGALGRGAESLLLFEDDCVPYEALPRDVEALLQKNDAFDVAVFDPRLLAVTPEPLENLPGCGWLRSAFWCTSCVLYTPTGRRRCLDAFATAPSVQIDNLLSQLALFDGLRVLCVQRGRIETSRMLWNSTIQKHLRVDDPLGDFQRFALAFPGVTRAHLRISIPLEATYAVLVALLVSGAFLVWLVERARGGGGAWRG